MSDTPQDRPATPSDAARPPPPPQYGAPHDAAPPPQYAAPPPQYGAPPPPYASPPPPSQYAPAAPLPGAYAPEPTAWFASWFSRVGSYLIDGLVPLAGIIVAVIGVVVATNGTTARTGPNAAGILIAVVGYALAFALNGWNRWYRAGKTGQSIGKQVLGTHLVGDASRQPIGGWLAFGRDIAHVVDGIFYLGYLWPIWDYKRQTFADKICSTVVLARQR